MPPDLVELSRQLANLIRLGHVAEVDHAAARIRVQSGGLLSTWIPWVTPRAGFTRVWNPPTVGEQVLILSPSGELAAGVALAGLYQSAHPAPSDSPTLHRMTFPDGAVIDYDHASHHLEVTGITTAHVIASASITLDAPMTYVTGQLDVEGLITYRDGIAGTGGSHGNHVTGSINVVSGDLTADAISLKTHVHGGVQSGGATTGAPQ
jgi:phage baseplate assembly protein V